MTDNDRYSSPLAERYASTAMLELWSPRVRYGLWRRLWLALAETQRELGVAIPAEAITQMRESLDDIDFYAVAVYEKRFRHDVVAHIHAYGDAAPAAKPFIHLGATSAFVTDNADLILMRRGLDLLRGKAIQIIRSLAGFAREWSREPTLGYTHLQPAQLTTIGKRATLWIQDLVLDVRDIDYRRGTLPFRGVKGTTGTQASFLEIFAGDHKKVRDLDRRVTAKMDFSEALAVTGQTYTRKLDAGILGVTAGIASTAGKFASDIRMLQTFGEIEEPFEPDQVGSSAMAYKRNPMRAERIASLARFVISLESNPHHTHAVQFFERTLDDSANRRLVIPESFLATDAILLLMANIVAGMEVYPEQIRRRVADALPFMATEELIVSAVKGGGDRQVAHEVIRKHSLEAARAMKNGSERNDMLERLAADPAFAVPMDSLRAALSPERFIGRSAQQVDEFLTEVVEPMLAGSQSEASSPDEVRV